MNSVFCFLLWSFGRNPRVWRVTSRWWDHGWSLPSVYATYLYTVPRVTSEGSGRDEIRSGWDQVAKREQGLNLQNDICRAILHLHLGFVRPSVINLCTILLYSIIAEQALQCGSTTPEHISSSRAYSTSAALRRRLSNGIPYT